MQRPSLAFRSAAGVRVVVVAGLLSIFIHGASHAETNTVYAFLRGDASARAAGLASSVVTMTDDPSMIFYNAASLSTLATPQGSVGFYKHLLDINAGHLSYSQRIGSIGCFGAGLIFMNYGSFDERDSYGNITGSFSANDIALSMAYSAEMQAGLHVGGGIKVIYSSLAGFGSTALAFDAGIIYAIPDTKVRLGGSIRNLGVQLSPYSTTRERLPLDLSIGVSVTPKGLPLLLNVNLHRLADDGTSVTEKLKAFSIGGEFTLSPSVQARIGYDNAMRGDLKLGSSADLAGFSAGIGITVQGYRLDYALSSLGKVGNLHRISVTTSF